MEVDAGDVLRAAGIRRQLALRLVPVVGAPPDDAAHALAVVLYAAAALYVGAGLIAFYLQHVSGPVLGGGLPSGG